MKTGISIILLIVVLVAGGVLLSSAYIVNEAQMVVVTQFGRPLEPVVTDPGLHFKVPFVQQLHYFEKRILAWDGYPNQVPTRDKKYIWVDTFARWRITDPLRFLQTVQDEVGAQARLDDIIDSKTRDNISRYILVEIVRNSNRTISNSKELKDEAAEDGVEKISLEKISMGRKQISKNILAESKLLLKEFGIELIDVEIKRINYIDQVRRKVFERMISERKRIAEKYRSEGEGKRQEIEGRKQRELKRIASEAYRTAQGIKGKADAEVIKIYADAYSKDSEFYSFLRTLETYKHTLKGRTTLILSTDTEYLRYLRGTTTKTQK